MNPSLRRGLVQLHRWLGLIVAPAIAYLALTGSTMLLRPHLERVVDSRLHHVSACERQLPLAQLIANANERHAEGAIRQLELTGGAPDATVIRYSDLRGVFVDPCSGAVLGEQQRWGGLFGTLEGLHRLRYFVDDGDVTEPITGTLSVVMGLMAALGIALWWPRSRGHLKRSLSLRSSLRGPALQMHLHRVIGVYAAAVLLISAVAAWTFTFDWARSALYAVTRSNPPAARPRPSAGTGPNASPDALLAAARNAVPDFDRMTIVLPKKPTDPVEVQILERDAPHPNARTTLYLDPRDARVLRVEPYATSSAGHKAYRWLASLHMGYVGGVAGQIVQGAAMLMVPVLLITGVRSFWRRRRAPQRSARAGSSQKSLYATAGPSARQIPDSHKDRRAHRQEIRAPATSPSPTLE
jgi:vanillate O-demethylase ferredoxin subunit